MGGKGGSRCDHKTRNHPHRKGDERSLQDASDGLEVSKRCPVSKGASSKQDGKGAQGGGSKSFCHVERYLRVYHPVKELTIDFFALNRDVI